MLRSGTTACQMDALIALHDGVERRFARWEHEH